MLALFVYFARGALSVWHFTMKTLEEDAGSLVRHRNRAGLTSDERNDIMYSEKSFKEVGKALREEQTVNNPTERNTRLRPRGLGRQASSTRQSSGEQSTGQATASSARLQLTKERVGILFLMLFKSGASAIAAQIADMELQRKALDFVRELHKRTDIDNVEKARIFNEKMFKYGKILGKTLCDSVINCLRELAVNALKAEIGR